MTEELRSLAADLSAAPRTVQRDAVGIITAGAEAVKTSWQDNARQSAGAHAPYYPDSITQDLELGGVLFGVLGAEIGPDKSRRQGALGNLIEFGSVNNPPNNDGGRALRDSEEAFAAAVAKAAENALG